MLRITTKNKIPQRYRLFIQLLMMTLMQVYIQERRVNLKSNASQHLEDG